MNKRKTKKKNNFIVENIQKFKLDEGEMLVFKFDIDKYSPEFMDGYSKYINNIIGNKVIFVPKDINISKIEGEPQN
jgi:hypothetical protein